MQNDLSHHLARAIIDDRVRAAGGHRRPEAQAEPSQERPRRARQRPLLIRARILLARLR